MKIGLQEIHLTLRGGGGPEPTGDAFFRSIRLAEGSGARRHASDSAWRCATAQLFAVSMDDVKDAEEPTEAFAERVQEGFEKAATLLAGCDRLGLDEWRARGNDADVFVGGWLANEQFDLKIPATFLSQCTRLGLSIRICTND